MAHNTFYPLKASSFNFDIILAVTSQWCNCGRPQSDSSLLCWDVFFSCWTAWSWPVFVGRDN